MSKREYKVIGALYRFSPKHDIGKLAKVPFAYFTLVGLRRKGYVTHGRSGWYITEAGRKAYRHEKAEIAAHLIRKEMRDR